MAYLGPPIEPPLLSLQMARHFSYENEGQKLNSGRNCILQDGEAN